MNTRHIPSARWLIASAVLCLALPSAITLTSCGGGAGATFVVDSVDFERTWTLDQPQPIDPLGGRSRFTVKLDYPVREANAETLPALNDSACAWLSRQLLPSADKPVLNKSILDRAAEIFFGETDGNEWGMDYAVEAHLVYQDDLYASYEYSQYVYTGGAHAVFTLSGQTFRKADGQPVEWRAFKQDDALRKALTAQLEADMKLNEPNRKLSELVLSDTPELFELPDRTFALPLPINVPYLTDKGWVFIYKPMEILPRIYGAPAACLESGKVTLID